MLRAVLVSAILILMPFKSFADVKLPALLSNNMVLQQQSDARFWGWAEPGEKINIQCSWAKEAFGPVEADKNGNWKIDLNTPKAGGPYEISIKGDNAIHLKNILIGEVWVCSGQSNMEMRLPHSTNGQEEVAKASYPNIRIFNVGVNYLPRPTEDVKGHWSECSSKTAAHTSAVAYYFGKKIHKEQNVPVGLIIAALGATPARAWTSGKTLLDKKMYVNEVKIISDKETIDKAKAKYKDEKTVWQEKIDQADPGMLGKWYDAQFDDSTWKTISLPSRIESSELGSYDGIVWYRKTLNIPAEWDGKNLTISLGRLDDRDETYLNGKKIGSVEGGQLSREYVVEGQLVKAGKNSLVVRIQDHGGAGGFMDKAKQMFLRSGKRTISLAGSWRYKAGSARSTWPGSPKGLPRINGRWPSALFNGMIAPLTSKTIRGAIWYQGENDVSGLIWYKPLFPNLIQSWRDAWGLGDFPFYHVQLPPYNYKHNNSALLREVQMKSLSMKNVGLAVTLDIGEYNDIHPRNKKDVGERLALWALAKDYGRKDIVCSGPIYKDMKVEGDFIRLHFDYVGSGLLAKNGHLTNFMIAGSDKKFLIAEAKIDKNTVVVLSDKVKEPVAVRYAFDNAGEPSLFNKEGLPASSFKTD